MSCEMISSRKVDYYVNDPYVLIVDIREREKYLKSRIKDAYNYEYEHLKCDINNIYAYGKVSFEFRQVFGNKDKIYILYCDRGVTSLLMCEKMSALGYKCKTIVGGFEAYKGNYIDN